MFGSWDKVTTGIIVRGVCYCFKVLEGRLGRHGGMMLLSFNTFVRAVNRIECSCCLYRYGRQHNNVCSSSARS